jgi:SepF-like predicted cell division protein (DUF552 family)
MKETFLNIKNQITKAFSKQTSEAGESDYVELSNEAGRPSSGAKVMVRPFVMEDFEDIKPVLDVLRNGQTIALVNIKPLKEKDLVELKRAINKLKKTCDAISGDIAGFGDDYIVATPEFASIYRNRESKEVVQGQEAHVQGGSQEDVETY